MKAMIFLSCIECDKGKYSLQNPHLSENCENCPTSASCDGGTSINLFPGYWRISNLTDQIVDCEQFAQFCL